MAKPQNDKPAPGARLPALRPKSRAAKSREIADRFKALVDGSGRKTDVASAWPAPSKYDSDDDND